MRSIITLGICVLFIGCGQTQAPPAKNQLEVKNGLHAAQVDTIARYVAGFPDATEISIALILPDTTYYFGLERRDGALVNKENRHAVFEIGSVSKVFTSTLLAGLVIEGKIGLEESIQTYFPFTLQEAERAGKVVSPLTLANHTSGLPRLSPNMMKQAIFNPQNPYADFDQKAMDEFLAEKMKLNTPPGEKYAYSNLGAAVLGYLETKVTGQGYETLLQERIFNKYGMTNTTTVREKVADRLVPGLNEKGKPTPNWDMDAYAPAGAILSDAVDLTKFARANFKPDTVLALQQQKTFTLSENMDLALGWHLVKSKEGDLWHWHNGGTGGYRSSFGLNLATKTGVVVLSNVSGGNEKAGNIDQLCYRLLATLP